MRKRIGGGEPEDGRGVLVRDRAEERVKLQQPADKSFFSLSAGICEPRIKPSRAAGRGSGGSGLPAAGSPGLKPQTGTDLS